MNTRKYLNGNGGIQYFSIVIMKTNLFIYHWEWDNHNYGYFRKDATSWYDQYFVEDENENKEK